MNGIADVPFYNVHLQLGSPRYVVLVNTAKFATHVLEKSEGKFVDEAGNAISANYSGHFWHLFWRGHLRPTVMQVSITSDIRKTTLFGSPLLLTIKVL